MYDRIHKQIQIEKSQKEDHVISVNLLTKANKDGLHQMWQQNRRPDKGISAL